MASQTLSLPLPCQGAARVSAPCLQRASQYLSACDRHFVIVESRALRFCCVARWAWIGEGGDGEVGDISASGVPAMGEKGLLISGLA